MNFQEYSNKALTTCHLSGEDKILEGGMGLSGESAEVLELIKKWKCQGHELDLEKVQLELGDTLWYIAELIDALELNFETILFKNLKKLKQRYPDGFDSRRSINREE
jgi:NTP pyrophosphatase (non-canonical NTP hydrolase)